MSRVGTGSPERALAMSTLVAPSARMVTGSPAATSTTGGGGPSNTLVRLPRDPNRRVPGRDVG